MRVENDTRSVPSEPSEPGSAHDTAIVFRDDAGIVVPLPPFDVSDERVAVS